MVFFTCNACGSSLKKNQVEKHYQCECPRCEVLSCMDCGKDFYGDEYASHTKCISEAAKYQGSLFKESGRAADGAGKGEKKQQEWLERIQGLVSEGVKVNSRIARLLERISQYPNIPRKKSKFENFVRNSINMRDHQTLEELWKVFSTAIKPSGDVKDGTDVVKATENGVEEADKDSVSEGHDSQPPTKKEKKKKMKVDPESEGTEIGAEGEEIKAKKKKQKKHVGDGPTNETADCGLALELEGSQLAQVETPVERKRHKKKRKHSTEHSETESSAEVKGDSNNVCSEDPAVNADDADNGTALLKKKKRKKSKTQDEPREEISTCVELGKSDGSGDDGCVGPMEVALEYINGCQQTVENMEGRGGECEEGVEEVKRKKKKRRSERDSGVENGDEVVPSPKKQCVDRKKLQTLDNLLLLRILIIERVSGRTA